MASNRGDNFDPNAEGTDDFDMYAPHKDTRVYSITDILGVEEFQEDFEYKTFCPLKSSSWEIIIKIEKEIPFNNFNMFVTLRRIDFMEYLVQGILVIWFLNIEGKRCPVPYRLEGLLKGGQVCYDVFPIDEHYRCLLRENDYMTFPDDVLILKAQLFIKECCGDKSGIEGLPLPEGFPDWLCFPKL